MQTISNFKNIATSGSTVSSTDIVFEGIHRPAAFFTLRESSEDIAILERYFSDIQNLFLKKLSAFAISDSVTDAESIKLRALLEEMIKVKQLILGDHF